MKFDMGATTLSTLTRQTSTSHESLGALVKDLVAAAEPLEGRFNGEARAAFDLFKNDTDATAAELDAALAAVLGGVAGMDLAFTQGEQEMADSTQATRASADFDAANFRSRA